MTQSSDNPMTTSLDRGADIIRGYVNTLPDTPGVYRMLDEKGDVLYVGKAKSLRKRVVNYTHPAKQTLRIQRMIAQTVSMEFVNTHTEVEALLLESNLIKKLKPRYNILLRDDKSFPYILITGGHEFPQLTKHRGARNRKGAFFGPFAAAGSVNRVLIALQRAFMLRNCTDSFFATRKRPCLQYHIKRCTAPCVGLISKDEYAKQVDEAVFFLSGKSHEIQAELSLRMQEASAAMEYEKAASFRDRIKALTTIQARQDINVEGLKDVDVIAVYAENARYCVQVFFFRGGQNFGNRAYFPRHASDADVGVLLAAFIAQFYESKPVPPEIILSHEPEEKELLIEALSAANKAGQRVTMVVPQRGDRKRLVEFAFKNAQEAYAREQLKLVTENAHLEAIAKLFFMEAVPQRIEVYDNSHISGSMMVGAMIVAGAEGFQKASYRKFNIKNAAASDDYGMMREVMKRRFARALKERSDKENVDADDGQGNDWPDLILIDGGLGQLNAVYEVLDELGIEDEVSVVSIAKGPDRNAGREKFFMRGHEMFQLPVDDPTLHYLQRLRDEAHRFAIGAHRTRRNMAISSSPLDAIPGIGAGRKKALLHHFGSAQEVANAGIADLEKVEGISRSVAEVIYNYFHE
jgi:excinuclease ABC subunit C